MNDQRISIYEMTKTTGNFDTVIVGLGKTGMSCVRYFANKGINFCVVDSRQQPPELDSLIENYPGVEFYLGDFREDILSNARQIFLSPGVDINEPSVSTAIDRGVAITGDIDLFCQEADKPVIAITGSNGKSTVATILGEMINASGMTAHVGGNIGTPALDLLELDEPDFFVLELSSFQLETLSSFSPVASVVLNISPDHMDRYSSLESYVMAKEKIYMGQGVMVINNDDKHVANMCRRDRKIISFTLTQPVEGQLGIIRKDNQAWLAYGTTAIMNVNELSIRGKHNIANALACLALGKAINLPDTSMLSALKKFSGLPHRCQIIKNINGIDWVDDSKGTNVGASCAAIEGVAKDKNIILIAGGEGKGADFKPLAEAISKHVRSVILIGRSAKHIASHIQNTTPVCFATSMDAAVATAAQQAKAGDTVLMSPACSSLDMYRDYQERGDVFINAVNKLPERADR